MTSMVEIVEWIVLILGGNLSNKFSKLGDNFRAKLYNVSVVYSLCVELGQSEDIDDLIQTSFSIWAVISERAWWGSFASLTQRHALCNLCNRKDMLLDKA
jgi:hypothetical protein